MEAIEFMDDFFLRSGSKHPTLLELPFAKHEIQWGRSRGQKTYVHGKLNGAQELSLEIDLWELEVPLEGKPKFLVHQVTGSWLKLLKPRDFYLETMKVVLVAAYFLVFAKRNPNSSQGAVWRYVRKECRDFRVKPNHEDLGQATLLLQSIVRTDPILQASPIIPQFFPNLSKNIRQQSVQGSDHSRKLLPVKREDSPSAEEITEEPRIGPEEPRTVPEEPRTAPEEPRTAAVATEVDPPRVEVFISTAGEIPNGSPGLQATPRMRKLADFGDIPVVVEEPKPKRRRIGRPALSAQRKRASKNYRGSGWDDWIDEPDVCAFCDDGVERGEKLICCDGPCMRSFHPTVASGRQNQCVTLGLKKAAVRAKRWMCPNCDAAQHQCFACGKLGNSDSSSAFQTVFLCGAKQCKRFYHSDCVAGLLLPLEARPDFASSIELKFESFTCPLHKCASCHIDEDKTDPDLCLIKCRRCPTAWHEKCLPELCRSQLWPLEGGKFVMYCGRHELDPELMTPRRDHILFPNSGKADKRTGQKLDLRLVANHKLSSASPGSKHHKLNAFQK